MDGLLDLCRRHFLILSVASYAAGLLHDLLNPELDAWFLHLDWKLTQFHVNYLQFGFAKRAVLGTLLYPVFSVVEEVGRYRHQVLAVGALDLAVFLAFVAVLRRAFESLPDAWQPWAAWGRLVLLLSPVGFVQWSYDMGRLDHVNFLLMVPAVLLLTKGRMLGAGLCLALGVLVHEAMFFFGVPAALAYLAVARRGDRNGLLVLLPPCLAIAAVLAFGNVDSARLSALPGHVDSGTEVWTRSVLEPAGYLRPACYAVLAFYVSLPLLWAFRLARSNPGAGLRLILPLAGTLALFVLGTDYFRWSQLVLFTVAAAVVLLARDGWLKPVELSRRARVLLLLYATPLGPIGIESALPYITEV